MLRHLIIFPIFLCLALISKAQDLQHLLEEANQFDERYPRESVYIQMDDAAYVVGDTLWYKAYVVRSGTLQPTDISRVLYVELLNDAGTLLERSILEIDSAGQAHGCFGLVSPLRNGYYEIRAYTRAMSNWGQEAQFSRVFPLFELPKKATPGDFTHLEVEYPKEKYYFLIPPERPYQFGRNRKRNIEFFPEGGSYIEGLEQHIAYRLTDGMGAPAFDSLFVYTATDSLLCTTVPEHLGTGTFLLPAGQKQGIYLRTSWSKTPHELPASASQATVLHVNEAEDAMDVTIQAAPALIQTDEEGHAKPLRAALVVLYRNAPKAVYPVELYKEAEEFSISYSDLGVGVNRLEVVSEDGQTLASRHVFVRMSDVSHTLPSAQIKVRQSAEQYDAFSPIALEFDVTDEAGLPLPHTTFAVAVHDADGELIHDSSASLQTQLLLCSELKGYVHNPEWYFARDDFAHRRALDLLMLTQGWQAQSFEQMCGQAPFIAEQPIEDQQIVRGKVVKDAPGSPKERKGIKLDLTMYNNKGEHRTGHAVTDRWGGFAFTPKEDFHDDWMAFFKTSSKGSNHKLWSRVRIDQWFGGQPRPYNPLEYILIQPNQQAGTKGPSAAAPLPDIFDWIDTIPNLRPRLLGEAVAKARRKYHPQTFNRYTYGGGEGQGRKHSDVYINVDWTLQQAWDHGIDFDDTDDFLAYIIGDIHKKENPNLKDGYTLVEEEFARREQQFNKADYEITRTVQSVIDQTEDNSDKPQETSSIKDSSVLKFKDFAYLLRINNGADIPGNQTFIPEQIKTLYISYDKVWANNLWTTLHPDSCDPPNLDGIIYIYTRPDWYNFRDVKGVNKRTLHGFTTPTPFKSPNYRASRTDNPNDFRRTLYWNPSLTTDDKGRASAVFFSNARPLQRLSITILGLTADGRVIEYLQ